MQQIKFKLFEWYLLGFGKSPNPKMVFKKLKNRSPHIQEYGIRKVASCYAKQQDHQKYNQLLSYFIPQLDLKNVEAEFYGKGGSAISLNTYRKVFYKDFLTFEKIYFNQYPNVNRVLDFYEKIYPFLKEHVRIPNIQFYKRGATITSIYFEFLKEINPLSENFLDVAFKQIQQLTQVDYDPLILGNRFATDRIHTAAYQRQYDVIEVKSTQRIELEKLKKYVSKQKRVLTHGDFNRMNVTEAGIIDWDDVGFYPYGIDMAGSLVTHFLERLESLSYEEVDTLIKEKFQLNTERIFSTLYYFTLLSSKWMSVERTDDYIKKAYQDMMSWED